MRAERLGRIADEGSRPRSLIGGSSAFTLENL